MANRTVIWTETAARQRREILTYWVKRNGTKIYAEKLIKLTAKQVKIILSNPFLYKKATFTNTHVASMGHFSIFYKITNNHLIITAFWDNRQDTKKILAVLKTQNT